MCAAIPPRDARLTSGPADACGFTQRRAAREQLEDVSIATTVDTGRSTSISTVREIGLTCRSLGPDGRLGAETHVGRTLKGAYARCLEGAALRSLAFPNIKSGDVDFADDVIPECVVAAPGASARSAAIPASAPSSFVVSPAWRTASCPADTVITGLELQATAEDASDAIMGTVVLHCRAIRRP